MRVPIRGAAVASEVMFIRAGLQDVFPSLTAVVKRGGVPQKGRKVRAPALTTRGPRSRPAITQASPKIVQVTSRGGRSRDGRTGQTGDLAHGLRPLPTSA